MLRDILYNFFHCSTSVCLIWNVAFLFGVYLLGLAMAYQIWVQPWRRHWSEEDEALLRKESFLDEDSTIDESLDDILLDEEDPPRKELGELFPEDKSIDQDQSGDRLAMVATAGVLGGLPATQAKDDFEEEESVFDSEERADLDLSDQRDDSLAPDGMRMDPLLGPVYGEEPDQTDDLTRIDGIDLDLEGSLNDLGIHRLTQVANWTPENMDNVSERLHLAGQIKRDDWVSQARHLVGLNGFPTDSLKDSEESEESEESPDPTEAASRDAEDGFQAPAIVDQQAAIGTFFSKEPVRVDPALGIVFTEKPEVSDDLTRIDGLSEDREWELNRLGIHRFQQIGQWSDHNVSSVADKLRIFKDKIEREEWIPQAQALHHETYRASQIWASSHPSLEEYDSKIDEDYQGEPVRSDGILGIVYDAPPKEPDELGEIVGISDLMAQWLQDSGVFRFQQIADWAEANVSGFAERLDIPAERIYSERWISQAQELAAKASFSELA